jgi:hypothetical protein
MADPNVVLVKFFVSNIDLVESLREVERNESRIEARHFNEAKALGIKEGAVREGVIDTGQHLHYEEATIWPALNYLVRRGYKIVDAHCFEQRKGQKKRYVAVLNFSKEDGAKTRPLNRQQLRQIDQLSRADAWGHVHYWENPNGIPTINCTCRLPDRGLSVEAEFMLDFDTAPEAVH